MIAESLRQNSREAILGFVLIFMRTRRQHKAPPPPMEASANSIHSDQVSGGTSEVLPDQNSDTHAISVGITNHEILDSGYVSTAMDVTMGLVCLHQNTMQLDELCHTDEHLAGSNADPMGTGLLSDNVHIPAAFADTFYTETPSLSRRVVRF
uniref:Uncharacterized protein n=1 Tax=Hyaloperonospora arabidopsidis (strain Emoy2) TaxID=559515 RepID=M4B3F6_HYAAE